jgi:hypothetical protein
MFGPLTMPEIRTMFTTFVEIQEKSRERGWVSCEIKNGSV